jgi:hypothetical protein
MGEDVSAAEECVVFLSGGLGSWAAAKRAVKKYGPERTRLVFTDVLIEHPGNYRFLLAGAANVFGRKLNWLPDLAEFPETYLPFKMGERPVLNPAWVEFLADLREKAALAIPELFWISDGRTPWDVFFDEKYIGNTLADPCSKILKRELGLAWLAANADPEKTALVFGIGWEEAHRYRSDKPSRKTGKHTGVQPRYAELGWPHVEAPLLESPWLRGQDVRRWARLEGLPISPSYGDGFDHDNCGGGCVKAGEGHWAHLLRTRPATYRVWESSEVSFNTSRPGRARQTVLAPERVVGVDDDGKDIRKRTPISLTEFREQIEAGAQIDIFSGQRGCGGCFLAEEAA